MRALTKREKTLLCVLGAVALLAGYWYMVYLPVNAQGVALDAEIAALAYERERVQMAELRIEPLEQRIGDARARLAEHYPGLSAGRDQAAWTRALEGVCTGEVTLSSLRFLEIAGDETLMRQIAELEVRAPSSGVAALIERLDAMELYAVVGHINVQAEQDGGCLVKLTLEIPYMP